MSPLTLCLAASVCFWISPPMKPRLGPIALVPSLAVRVLASSRGRPNEAAKKRHGQLRNLSYAGFYAA
jgi:hypothetical protein